MTDVTEEELEKIINSKKCKSVRINGKNYYISKKVKEAVKRKRHEGGILPLLALIPAAIAGFFTTAAPVAAGVTAVAGAVGAVAGATTGIVYGSRQAANEAKKREILELQKQAELKKLQGQGIDANTIIDVMNTVNKYKNIHEKASAAREHATGILNSPQNAIREQSGQGLYLNPYQGKALHKYLKNIDPKFIHLTKKFKNGAHAVINGRGLYLKPYNSKGNGIAETETETETDDDYDDYDDYYQ